MIYKLGYDSKSETPEFREKFGGPQMFPPNMKEITIEEFAQSGFFTYSPSLIEYRQVNQDKEGWKKFGFEYGPSIWLYYFHHDEGFVLYNDYWKKQLRVFTFAACIHEWRPPTNEEIYDRRAPRPAMCFHVSVCEKCHAVNAVDSSD